jgi:hypothetical protein
LSLIPLGGCALRGPALQDQITMNAVNALFYVTTGQDITQIPRDRLELWMVRFGKAFGPAGVRHFSELDPAEKGALLERLPILKTNHTDWPSPLRWVPRTFTVWIGGAAPTEKDILDGSISVASVKPDGTLLPIPACGDDYVLRGYMASTRPITPGLPECLHNRVGFRYDDVESEKLGQPVWFLSFALKQVP